MGGGLLLVVVALTTVTALPVPVWVSRAVRSKRPRKALSAAGGAETSGGPAATARATLASEVTTAIDLLGRARDSVADYAAAAPLMWLLDRGSSDNWVKRVARQAQYDESEAGRALGRVLEALGEIAEPERERLEAVRSALSARIAEAAAEQDERPGRIMGRTEARTVVRRLETTLGHLENVLEIMAARADPYR